MVLQADFNMYFVSLTMVFISNNKTKVMEILIKLTNKS